MGKIKLIRYTSTLFIAVCFILAIILPCLPVKAVITYYPPDIAFSISKVEAYEHLFQDNDRGFLISYNIACSNTTLPATPIEDTYLFWIADNTSAILGATTGFGYHDNGYSQDAGASPDGYAWIYFPASTAPTWSGNYTVHFSGSPTLSWDGGLIPDVTSTTIDWLAESSMQATRDRLTIRMRALARSLEVRWSDGADLITETTTGDVFTTAGEVYFTTIIDNLRTLCPDLFYQSMEAAVFPEDILVEDYYVDEIDSYSSIHGANDIYAQTFTASIDESLTGVQIPVYRTGLPGAVTISLRATLAGLPTGGDIVSASYDGDSVTTETTGEWISVVFSTDYDLNSGTVYAIVVRATAAPVGTSITWCGTAAGSYTGGQECFFNGAIWAAVAGHDNSFELLIRGGQAWTYGHRYEIRLFGTEFDVSQIATNWGVTNQVVSTMFWLLMTFGMMYAVSWAVNAWDIYWLVTYIMAAYGWRAGFCSTQYLVIVLIISVIGIVYGIWYRRTY